MDCGERSACAKERRDRLCEENQFRANTRRTCAKARLAARVPGPKKELTRQRVENAAGETPANSAHSRGLAHSAAARYARNFPRPKWSRRIRDAGRRLDEANCAVAAHPKARSQTGMNKYNRARRLGPSRFLRESATCEQSLRRVSRYSTAISGRRLRDCDLVNASAPAGRRGCAPECDEILRPPPASDR